MRKSASDSQPGRRSSDRKPTGGGRKWGGSLKPGARRMDVSRCGDAGQRTRDSGAPAVLQEPLKPPEDEDGDVDGDEDELWVRSRIMVVPDRSEAATGAQNAAI